MLTEICQYLRNWFERDKIFDTFTVTGGVLTAADTRLADILQSGQYYRIAGSAFNDGVHKWTDAKDPLADEKAFDGAVWTMAVPPAVVALDAEIMTWVADHQAVLNSPFASESFANYSYTLKSGGGRYGSGGISWQSQFETRLAAWRKI